MQLLKYQGGYIIIYSFIKGSSKIQDSDLLKNIYIYVILIGNIPDMNIM